MAGPPPKHPSRRARRNDPKVGFGSLPAEGRKGDAPAWPMQPDVAKVAHLDQVQGKLEALRDELDEATDGRTKGRLRTQIDKLEVAAATLKAEIEQANLAEVALWDELWTTPQAVMWDESSAFARLVAQFVRWNIRAEQGDLKAATEARLRGAELGLSPLALLKLRREVEETKAAEDRGAERRQKRQPAQPKGDEGKGDPRSGLYAVS